MAFCTNCGQEILPGEKFCSHCGHPVKGMGQEGASASGKTERTICIQMNPAGNKRNGPLLNQKVSVFADGLLVWEGVAADRAEFKLERPAKVEIKYKGSLMSFSASQTLRIDPSDGPYYNVECKNGPFGNKLIVSRVDRLD